MPPLHLSSSQDWWQAVTNILVRILVRLLYLNLRDESGVLQEREEVPTLDIGFRLVDPGSNAILR